MHVTRNGLHTSQILCTARELYFVHCILCVLHDSKMHTSNILRAARCAACKLTTIRPLPEKN